MENCKLNIGVVNFPVNWGNKKKNLENLKKYCIEAAENGVEMVVFPETCLCGYDYDGENDIHKELAESLEGECVSIVKQFAVKYNMYVIFGLAELVDDKVYNSAAIVFPNGEVDVYRKMHLPFDEKKWAICGNEPKIFETKWGKVGVSICYDTYCFPELIRYYRAMGARLVLNVTACPDNACTMGAATLSLPAYSFINYVYIASANLCGQEKYSHFSGGSCVVMPDETKGGVKTVIGTFFGEKGSDKIGLFNGVIDLSLADKNTDIPIYDGDFRAEKYAELYDRVAKNN